MLTLIAKGTGVAWLFSVVATLAPGIFPDVIIKRLRGGGRVAAMAGDGVTDAPRSLRRM